MIKLVVNIRESATLPTNLSVTFFDEISIRLKYDSVCSTFAFKMFFDPNNEVHSELAAVSHIHECKIYYVHEKEGKYAINENSEKTVSGQTKDELIITGYVLSQKLSNGPNPSYLEIGGYSKAGVLQDCDFPTKAYPLETNGLSFRDIVKNKVLPYFKNESGFGFRIKSSHADSVFLDDENDNLPNLYSTFATKLRNRQLINISETLDKLNKLADFDLQKTNVDSNNKDRSTNILSYLKELAIQKDMILSTDIFGNLIVNDPYIGDKYLFEIGTGNNEVKCMDMETSYNGQLLHSDIEVQSPVDKDGGNQGYFSISNPLVPIVYRPKSVTLTSGNDTDCETVARRTLRSELSAVSLKITLDTPSVNGRFIMPNNTVLVKDARNYLYNASKWFVEEVEYEKNADGEKCTVFCVMPSVYAGEVTNPFVAPNENLGRTR